MRSVELAPLEMTNSNGVNGMRNNSKRKKLVAAVLSLVLMTLTAIAHAEIKVIEADSAYVMGDNDSKVDARRIAIQEAKRKALELAGTYVESLTQVREYRITRDEVKAYTGGIIETEIIADETRGSLQHPEMYVKARCKIDSDVVAAQIGRYKENEDLKEQLQVSSQENESLKKERDALVKQLAAQKNSTKAEETRKKLDIVLDREEANDDINKVWVNIGPQLTDAGENVQVKEADLDKSAAILQRSIVANPGNQRGRFLLAAIYQKKGNDTAAERELRTAIQRNPSNPVAHMKLGILLMQKGRYREALQEFHFVERVRPHNSMMFFYSGMALKAMGRCGRAIFYLERFLKEPRANRLPKQKEQALQAVKDCGGVRGGYQQRARYNK